jgi:alkane 1-monooxygenase
MGVLPHLLAYVIPLAALVGALLGGTWVWLALMVGLVVHPMLDLAAGNRAESRAASHGAATAILVAYPLFHLALLAVALTGVRTGAYSLGELAGLALSIGLAGGAIGITAAHELVHRARRWERGAGVAMLCLVSYAHFRVEHVFGHHRHVATPLDPATARRGEGLYAFWVRSIVGGWRSAWRIEANRARARGRSPLDPENRLVAYVLAQSALTALAAAWAGATGVALHLGQGLVAILLLETINYLEHYGLQRAPRGDGFEPVAARHSWDSPRRLTNFFLFNLGLHADHHLRPLKPYESLHAEPEAPRLPTGYSGMLLVALVPPLWRRVMDRRLDEFSSAASTPAS